jgi:multidrug efflux system outer membrane protein
MRDRIPKAAALALAALLAACIAVGPDYQRPWTALPATFSAAGAAGDREIQADWWKLYGDPTLDELVVATQANNADMRLAAARVQEAEGVLREASGSLYPEVKAGVSASRSRVSQNTVPTAVAPLVRPQQQILLSTGYELDFWGRVSRLNETARASLLGTQHARDVVALTLVSAAAQTYFALRSLDAQLAVLERTIKTRSDSLDIARARLNSGLASELDVYQAQAALSDALVQRRDTERQRAILQGQLGQLTGRLDLKIAPGDLFTLPVPPTPPAGLPSELIDRRPDIRSAEQALIATNAQIGVARAALFPSINLTAGLGTQSAQFSDLLVGSSRIWSAGFGLDLPIFDGGRRSARVDQARARERQALAAYQKAIETGFREVSEGLINVEQSGATEADLANRLEAARKSLELSNLRYQSGYSPFLEVLDAQRTANDAELAFVRNRQARLSFSVDLMKALGGGWTDPAVSRADVLHAPPHRP